MTDAPGRVPSEVDAYLDQIFDLLAGTGAAGRRALADLIALLKGFVTTVASSADGGLPDRILAVLTDGLRPPRP
ncbi:MAG TPA: hypothetical protein VIY28_08605 [Pseudonocardiaceae bacterium]